MLTFTGTANVSFDIPATSVTFAPAAILIFAPQAGQILGSLSLVIVDPTYNFSEATWSFTNPMLSASGTGPTVQVLLDATTLSGVQTNFPIAYSVSF